ncbi:hypothetical protein QQ045_010909 [Rhodiola kirilowii]
MAMLAYQNPKISLNIEFDLRIADSWCLTEATKIRNCASDGSLSKGKKRVHMRVSEAADSSVRRELLRISSRLASIWLNLVIRRIKFFQFVKILISNFIC